MREEALEQRVEERQRSMLMSQGPLARRIALVSRDEALWKRHQVGDWGASPDPLAP